MTETDIDQEEFQQWKQMINLDSANPPTEQDWYSTRTFELFLDALDIDQPVILVNKDNCQSKVPSTNQATHVSNRPTENCKEFDNTLENKSREEIAPKQRYADETILSAEALKILSELPDLSYMSATRSFICPKAKR